MIQISKSRALGKMKCSEAAGPSGIITEMLRDAGEEGVGLVRKLVEAVFSSGMIPVDCEESFIQNLYKVTMVTTVVSSSQIKSWSCWNRC